MSSLQEHIARHERAEDDAAPNESWWDLRRRLSGVEEQLAARDAVIAKVQEAVDGPHPANSGLDSFTLAHISAQFDAAPETVLAEVKAQAWDEACEAFAWCRDNGPLEDALPYVIEHNPYRNGATHE